MLLETASGKSARAYAQVEQFDLPFAAFGFVRRHITRPAWHVNIHALPAAEQIFSFRHFLGRAPRKLSPIAEVVI